MTIDKLPAGEKLLEIKAFVIVKRESGLSGGLLGQQGYSFIFSNAEAAEDFRKQGVQEFGDIFEVIKVNVSQ